MSPTVRARPLILPGRYDRHAGAMRCPHCATLVPRRALVCTGCGAQATYLLTGVEAGAGAILGAVLGRWVGAQLFWLTGNLLALFLSIGVGVVLGLIVMSIVASRRGPRFQRYYREGCEYDEPHRFR